MLESYEGSIDAGQTLTVDVRIEHVAQHDDTQDIEFAVIDDADLTVHSDVERDLALDGGVNASLVRVARGGRRARRLRRVGFVG